MHFTPFGRASFYLKVEIFRAEFAVRQNELRNFKMVHGSSAKALFGSNQGSG